MAGVEQALPLMLGKKGVDSPEDSSPTSACMMCIYFSTFAVNGTPTIGCIKSVTDLSRSRWTPQVLFSVLNMSKCDRVQSFLQPSCSGGRCLCKGSAFCKVCHGDPFGAFPCGEGLMLW